MEFLSVINDNEKEKAGNSATVECTDIKAEAVQIIESQNAFNQPTKSSKAICKFFMQGRCSRWEVCSFSHDISKVDQADMNLQQKQVFSPPIRPPIIVNIPPGSASIFSIDVECVATGTHHNARTVAQVALVDEWGRPICNLYIKADVPVSSYLTPLTGFSLTLLHSRYLDLLLISFL